ncbi:MAG TPA: TlpA disulfide reductase family protein [Terriglobales bacterium]|nr:TlpA disulfide reductase family protein [Terriglobales bacterium]
MRSALVLLLLSFASFPLSAQQVNDGPANEKAQKTYKEALEYLHRRAMGAALDDFKKADKQDDGHCRACQRQMIKYGMELRDWKTAELAAQERTEAAQGNQDLALAHYDFGLVLMNEALEKKKDDLFVRVHDEMTKAVAAYANFSAPIFIDGQALAHLNRADEAKAEFERYVKMTKPENLGRRRALRFISEPELALARMAPPFEIVATNGQRVSLDDLPGKVVLVDFWATWCGPCREALPHMREIAKKFQDQPLVVISISLDDDEQKWKDFIDKNGMTWLQYHDVGGFKGSIARAFGVEAIPHTFTIDADGVLQDERIGDASIEGKLKKLLARARELQVAQGISQ